MAWRCQVEELVGVAVLEEEVAAVVRASTAARGRAETSTASTPALPAATGSPSTRATAPLPLHTRAQSRWAATEMRLHLDIITTTSSSRATSPPLPPRPIITTTPLHPTQSPAAVPRVPRLTTITAIAATTAAAPRAATRRCWGWAALRTRWGRRLCSTRARPPTARSAP